MFRFLLGLATGAFFAYWFQQRWQHEAWEARMREFRGRSEAEMEVSRRILGETRGELSSALEAGRESVQHKVDRLKGAAERTSGSF